MTSNAVMNSFKQTFLNTYMIMGILCMCVAFSAFGKDIYVLRHYEKQLLDSANPQYKNPSLSAQGEVRAKALARFMHDKGITTIISSDYKRTKETALPTSQKLGIEIKVQAAKPSLDMINAIYNELGNTIIVGHSNTVPDWIIGFGGPKISISERQYGDLFLLHIADDKSLTFEHSLIED